MRAAGNGPFHWCRGGTVAALLFCLLFVLVRGAGARAAVLLVVGTVTDTSARVLHEALSPELVGSTLNVRAVATTRVKGADNDGSPNPGPVITLAARAQVVQVEGLNPCSEYVVDFVQKLDGSNDNDSDNVLGSVTFRTQGAGPTGGCPAGEDGQGDHWSFVAVSCDRHADFPYDTGFKSVLATRVNTAPGIDLMVHLGDQIYADRLVKRFRNASFEDSLEAFRDLYRTGWGTAAMSAILRRGSHWMVPDDHDVMNALQPGTVDTDLGTYTAAGLRAVLEYQIQLNVDIAPLPEQGEAVSPTAIAESMPPLWRFSRRGSTALALLDTRFQRSFASDYDAQLTGSKQLQEFQSTLHMWSQDPTVKAVVVFSSIPLFFPSPTLAVVADVAEGDKYGLHPHNVNNTIALLDATVAVKQAGKHVLLVGGDTHMYSDEEVCLQTESGTTCLDSVVSSGLTIGSSTLDSVILTLYQSFELHILPPAYEAAAGLWYVVNRVLMPVNCFVVVEAGGPDGVLRWTPVLRDGPEQLKRMWLFRCGGHIIVAVLALLAVVVLYVLLSCLRCLGRLACPGSPAAAATSSSSKPRRRGKAKTH
eukprot:m.239724 g.239724  ORF g.239724 m.239724 type:complete len:590 (+) comp18981_c2_seq3:1959-3728(+)